MEKEKKIFAAWWFWILLLVVISSIIIGGLNYAGIIGRTIVEREVFEQSYQRSESLRTEVATYEAQLAEIRHKLSSDIDSQTRTNLEAQASSIRVLLRVARSKQ